MRVFCFIFLVINLASCTTQKEVAKVKKSEGDLITYRNFNNSDIVKYSNLSVTKDSTIVVSQKGNRLK